MKRPRWLVPFALAALLGWWVSRPTGPSFVRLPGSGVMMPEWQMDSLTGEPVDSAQFAGRVVVLNFWATWCPPCRREIPELNAVHRAWSERGVAVLGAATDERGAAVVGPFARRHRIQYPVLIADTNLLESLAIASLPTTLVIATNGQVVARYLGTLTEREISNVVQPLLPPQ
ncbi:MAG: TlpA family protein disulfide reductase [Verrucomicrobiae bacterium]|nr:TlpA family protein disulfide reductase [Verrucomicrobiae bacterium]